MQPVRPLNPAPGHKLAVQTAAAKPKTLSVLPDRLPPSLVGRPVWVCWRWVRVRGRWTKPPICARTLGKADVTDPAVPAPFADALDRVNRGRADGVGVVLASAGLLGVDLDDCRDPASGVLAPWVGDVVRDLDSYAEASPSGTGVKVLVGAAKPGRRCRTGHVELYDAGRYFTMTGHVLPGCPAEPQARQAAVDDLYARAFDPAPAPRPARPAADAVLDRAFAAANGAKLRRLWDGDTAGYGSASEAELALCAMLAFYFPDPAELDAAFRRSKLYRPKWDRDDYRAATIGKALAGRSTFYTPGGASAGPPAEADPWHAPPAPLPTLAPVPPFPLGALPAKVANYFAAAAESLNVPVDYVAVPGLALLGAAVGRTRAAAVKSGYAEPPAVWALVVAPPGSTKSAALKSASGPFTAAEMRWREQQQEAMSAFEVADAQYAQAAKAWQAGGCQGGPPEKPRKPMLRQAVLDGFTGEALVRGLAANPRGLVVCKDELSGLVAALNAYRGGRGDDRERLLSCWTGAVVKVNRVSDADAPPLLVPHPFLAVCGMICPDALPALRGERAGADAPSDGFADRFLMAFPDPLPAAAESWRTVPPDLGDGYAGVVLDLLGLDFAPDAGGQPRPHLIPFDDGARGVYEAFTAAMAGLMNGLDMADPFRGVLSKLKGYAARLACVLWCAGRACGEVDPDAPIDARVLCAAVDLVDYFSAHARRCLGRGVTDRAGRVSRRLASWLAARPGLAAFTRSEAFQQLKDRRDVTKGADLDAPLALLVDHGFIRIVAGEVGARPGPVPQTFAVNPHWERGTPNAGDFGDENRTSAAA